MNKLIELYENPALMLKHDELQNFLDQDPPESWLSEHPYITVKNEKNQKVPYKYLPIDKIEWMLKRFFKRYRIEVISYNTAFNGVVVHVRVHYLDPLSGEMIFQDGIGAEQLQTKTGTSPADLANINNGAISMAFPKAKSTAIKDACDHIGRIFGGDIGRKNTIRSASDNELKDYVKQLPAHDEDQYLLKTCKSIYDLEELQEIRPDLDIKLIEKRKEELRK